MTLLTATGLGYRLGAQQVVAGIDLTVDAGECVAVVGPSGSGKSTFLALLSGALRPTAGRVLLDGMPLDRPAGPRHGVAVVLQGYGLIALLTAAENVAVALRAAGRPPRQAFADARASLEDVGLGEHADHLVEELSGGQQQRTAVARALALEPRLLVADEPTAELDAAARALVLDRILAVAARGGSVVVATHDADVAGRCDRVLELRPVGGSARQDGGDA